MTGLSTQASAASSHHRHQRRQEQCHEKQQRNHDRSESRAAARCHAGRALDVGGHRGCPKRSSCRRADRVGKQCATSLRERTVLQQSGLISNGDKRAHRIKQCQEKKYKNDRHHLHLQCP